MQRRREPVFNLPRAMVAAVALLLLIHILRLMLPVSADAWTIYAFGFVPARYGSGGLLGYFPGGFGADLWTFITYAFLHGDWLHVGVNVTWMVAFGTPLLRRFGTARFLALSAAAAIGGALAHLVSHWEEIVPMIGASAAISGQMAAAIRFAFRGGPFGGPGPRDDRRWQVPALPLREAFRDIRVVVFVGVWFAVNFLFGTTGVGLGEGAAIAWEAHIGGFLVGLFLFRLFDPWQGAPSDPREIPGDFLHEELPESPQEDEGRPDGPSREP